jgi:hypothetical protein
VEVVDTKVGDAFQLEIRATEALDAFHHPYAYAAFRGCSRRQPDARTVADAVVELEQETLSYL